MSGLEATLTPPEVRTNADAVQEWLRCSASCAYFVDNYVRIFDPVSQNWIPFNLWPFQVQTLRALNTHRLTVILKARQLGLSWLVLAQKLWRMIFRPVANVLLFSRREDEAHHMLERLKGMYERLPAWMRGKETDPNNSEVLGLSNGSIARAFPTNAGDSYAATDVLADEFDLVEDQNRLMRSVKPTIDAGGSMTLLSRVDKDRPQTEFKNIFRAARAGLNNWFAIFLPWFVRPDRTPAWYAEQKRDSLTRTGSLDDLHEQYPATEEEALAPRSLNKRIALGWLDQCYQKMEPLAEELLPAEAPAIPGLKIYRLPRYGATYVAGADPAEGNPTSDDSAFSILERNSGEEVASLAGKFQPSVFASNLSRVCAYFNNAAAMVERNNHGHAVLLWLRDNAGHISVLTGRDGNPGWHSTSVGKALLYDTTADAFKDRTTILHGMETYLQLASIEGASLRAPEGEMDDKADGYALGLVARLQPKSSGGQMSYINGDGEEED